MPLSGHPPRRNILFWGMGSLCIPSLSAGKAEIGPLTPLTEKHPDPTKKIISLIHQTKEAIKESVKILTPVNKEKNHCECFSPEEKSIEILEKAETYLDDAEIIARDVPLSPCAERITKLRKEIILRRVRLQVKIWDTAQYHSRSMYNSIQSGIDQGSQLGLNMSEYQEAIDQQAGKIFLIEAKNQVSALERKVKEVEQYSPVLAIMNDPIIRGRLQSQNDRIIRDAYLKAQNATNLAYRKKADTRDLHERMCKIQERYYFLRPDQIFFAFSD